MEYTVRKSRVRDDRLNPVLAALGPRIFRARVGVAKPGGIQISRLNGVVGIYRYITKVDLP